MATIDYKQKIKDYMNSSEVDTLYKSMLNNLFPELAESEDEKIRKDIIVLVKDWWDRVNKDNISTKEQMIAWLKSLRPQSQWKPSEEQMEFVWKYAEQNNYDGKVFARLYNDLKKLKGE